MSPRQDVGLRSPARVSSPPISASASAAPSSNPRFLHPFPSASSGRCPPAQPGRKLGGRPRRREEPTEAACFPGLALGGLRGRDSVWASAATAPEVWQRGLPSACDRPGARATVTRRTSASAPVPWAARVGGTPNAARRPSRRPRVPATGLWRPLAVTWGAPRRDARGAANCQKGTKIGNGRS